MGDEPKPASLAGAPSIAARSCFLPVPTRIVSIKCLEVLQGGRGDLSAEATVKGLDGACIFRRVAVYLRGDRREVIAVVGLGLITGAPPRIW